MFKRRLLEAAVLAAMVGAAGVANAVPTLMIAPAATSEQHIVNDAGGNAFPWGVPTIVGGFPYDTTGYLGNYLEVSGTTTVTFQYVGDGNATQDNSFWVYNGGWTNLFTGASVNGSAATVTFAASDFIFGGSLVPFAYDLNQGTTGPVDCASSVYLCNNGSDNVTQDGLPSAFLGVDPALGAGDYATSGGAVYAGLSDRFEIPTDHQDLGVRVSVPEPGSLALLGVALVGLAAARKRKSAGA